MSNQAKTTRKRDFHVWVQTAGGVMSILVIAGGALIALFQSHPVRIGMAVGCAAIVGYGAYKRKWWFVAAPLIALITLVALAPSPAPNNTAQQPQSQAQASQPSTSASTGTAPVTTNKSSQSDTPKPIATFDLDLKPHDAVDIDNPSGAIISNDQSGASGKNDMFLYTNPVASPRIYVNNSSPLVYPQNTNGQEYNACANKLNPNSGANRYDWSGVSIDTKMCFVTSDENMAYAAITGVDQPNGAEPPRTVTLHVIVWKNP